MSKSFSVSGTLTKVDWINPHIMMLLDVNGEEWKFQSNPPAWFRRVGIARADFADAIGQKISVDGVRARDGSKFGYMLRAKFASGRALELVREEGKQGKRSDDEAPILSCVAGRGGNGRRRFRAGPPGSEWRVGLHY